MIYVTYDEQGNLTGKYVQDVRPEHEQCYIEVSEEDGHNWLNFCANESRDGLNPAPAVTPSPANRNFSIFMALEAIDRKSIRALREGNQERIDTLEAEAANLRQQLMKE